MTQFIFGIIGIVFMGIMIDILYPNGKTSGFCKSIFAIVSLFVIIKPILSLGELNFDYSYEVDSVFIDKINNSRIEALKYKIEESLNNRGFSGVDVEIDGFCENNNIILENIYVDISSLVLTENLKNINKYEVILDEITNVVEVDEEKVIIYG